MSKIEGRNGHPGKSGRRPGKRISPSAPKAAAPEAPVVAPVAVPAEGGDGRANRGIRSYALLERDTMALYMSFYKHTYGKSTLDRKTKEFIAIAAALATGCKNCLEGHLKKAVKHGATRAEISEVMAVTLGVAAATMVDRSDIAAANIGLDPESWTIPDDS